MDCISSYHILFQTCSTCCNPSSALHPAMRSHADNMMTMTKLLFLMP